VGFGVQALLLGVAALGSGGGLEVHWDAPEGCPGKEAVETAFSRHAKEEHAAVLARGTVSYDGATYVLDLELVGPSGTEARRIEADTCDSLAETAGLLSAVASEAAVVPSPAVAEPVAPARVEPPKEDEPEPEPPPEAEPQVRESEPFDREPPGAEQSFPFGLLVRIDGQLHALRLLPRIVGGGVAGAVGVRGARWRAEFRGQYVAPQPRDYADVVVGGSFDLWTLAAVGCWEPAAGRVSFPLCAGFEAGSLRGRTEDVEQPGAAGAFYGGVTADGAVVFAPIPRVALRAGAGGIVSVVRPEYHVRDQETLFRAGAGALRGFLGVEVRFL
jgi:hypothetical protein